MPETKMVKDMSVLELKAHVYDRLAVMNQYQKEIDACNAELQRRDEASKAAPSEVKQ